VRGLVVGILGAFAAGGAVIGTGKTYAASLGGGDASYGILFGGVFVGYLIGAAAQGVLGLLSVVIFILALVY